MEEDNKPEIVQSIQKGRFFSETRVKNQGNNQTTTVTVNIDKKENIFSECFRSLAECFKRR